MKDTVDTIIQIQKIRSLPFQNENVPENNEHFPDLSDSTSETIPTSRNKLRIDHIKIKIKNSTDNHKNYRVHNMNKKKSYKATNDKNRKHIFKHNKAQQKSKIIQFLQTTIGRNSIKHNKNHISAYIASIPK